jgi:predicted signal transduction protein with EAL and GGDEF domain
LSWEQVIDIADRALYAAKKSGRNLSVGLAANSSTARDNLYTHISSNLPALIDNKELTVITTTDKPLVWD